MSDERMRIMERSQQGFCCSQILLMMGLEERGEQNPDLVRAMGGLCGGIGSSGKACGALTGGVCLLSMYVGRGLVEEQEPLFGRSMISQLVEWFENEIGAQYGGVDCLEILEENPMNRTARCPEIVYQVYQKVAQILEEYGYSIKDGKGE